MKKFIMATVIAACIALCAAVCRCVVAKQSGQGNTRPVPNARRVRHRSGGCRTQNGSPNHANVRERKRSSSANKSTLGNLR